ncbi:MAG: YggT family protein, partial [Acidimicrobiales bacterium]
PRAAYDSLFVLPILCAIFGIYRLVLIARAITSFFPVTPGTSFAQIVEVLYKVTEPVLAPLRRIIPPLGMFDLSFLVLLIGLQVISAFLGCRGLL